MDFYHEIVDFQSPKKEHLKKGTTLFHFGQSINCDITDYALIFVFYHENSDFQSPKKEHLKKGSTLFLHFLCFVIIM